MPLAAALLAGACSGGGTDRQLSLRPVTTVAPATTLPPSTTTAPTQPPTTAPATTAVTRAPARPRPSTTTTTTTVPGPPPGIDEALPHDLNAGLTYSPPTPTATHLISCTKPEVFLEPNVWFATFSVTVEGGSDWERRDSFSPVTLTETRANPTPAFEITSFTVLEQLSHLPVSVPLPDALVLHVSCPA